MNFTDKNILIVGGTSGIGKAIAAQLAATEARLWTASRHAPEDTDRITHLPLDVTEMEKDALQELPDTLHGLVYCPGTINLKPFQSLKPEDFTRDFDLNVLGAVRVIQACLKPLRAAKGASIVLFSTVATKAGMNYHTSVATAKSALEGLSKSLAAELASKQIRVNTIAPSLTDTPLAQQLLSTEEKREASRQRHPLGRYGRPEDIASLAVFLLSGQGSWITGQSLSVDGGLSSLRPI